MMLDIQLAANICRDSTGLQVGVEDVDIYDYVHFSILDRSDWDEDKTESAQMSHVAFAHRFTKLGNSFANRKAA